MVKVGSVHGRVMGAFMFIMQQETTFFRFNIMSLGLF